MVVCPDCGKEVPDANFCKNCGAALPKESEIVDVEDTTQVEAEVVETIPVKAEEVGADEEIPSNSSNKANFCHSCGFKLDGNFKFCPNCGYDLENKRQVRTRAYDSVVTTEEKNIIVSIILSVIIPGLGHFYLGLSRKGATFLLAYVVSAILMLLLIGFILVLIIWIWALVDVIQSTNALNNGESVEDKLL